MREQIPIQLGAVQETLLVPLLGRAQSTRSKRPLVVDPKAVEIVEQLDYDFTKWESAKTLVGATIRTRMMDEDVADFISQHPSGTVVEIGCGLNTRFERLDNGRIRWFDLDLPDSIELRQKFFQDTSRRTMISASALDTDWYQQVRESEGPYCFVSEAVLIYLEPIDGRRAVSQIAAAFPGAWLIMDTVSREMVQSQEKHEIMRTMSQDSWFRWECDDPQSLEDTGLKLVRSRTFLDASDEIVRSFPWFFRFLHRFLPWLLKRKISGYRLNRFHCTSDPARPDSE